MTLTSAVPRFYPQPQRHLAASPPWGHFHSIANIVFSHSEKVTGNREGFVAVGRSYPALMGAHIRFGYLQLFVFTCDEVKEPKFHLFVAVRTKTHSVSQSL